MKAPSKPKRNAKNKLNDKCVVYARYSSHSQRDISIEQQVEKAKQLAEELGLLIVDIYSDRAISGRSDNRPDFQRMMHDAKKGQFRYVISWKSSRIGRNMMEAMINEARLSDLGVRLIYVEEDFEDNAAGRFAARSMMNVNQFYSESMSEDILRGLRSNAEKCMLTNGTLPLGYTKDAGLHYVIDEPKAELVREIFSRVAEGENFIDIARSLNARGIPTSFGNKWNKNSFRGMLSNERYRGIYIYDDIRVEGGIPRIIDENLWFRTQEALKVKKAKKSYHKGSADYMLTGKLFCGECGAPMVGISGTGKSGAIHYYYSCNTARKEKTCKKKNMRRDPIERTVAEGIKEYILQPDVIEWIADSVMQYQKERKDNPELQILKSKLAEVKSSIKNIMKAIEQGIITETTKQRLQELEQEQEQIKANISVAEYGNIDISRDTVIKWLETFKDGKIEDKKYMQKLFDSFLTAVYLYDDDRVKVVFDIGGDARQEVDLNLIEGAESKGEKCSYKLLCSPPMFTRVSAILRPLFFLAQNIGFFAFYRRFTDIFQVLF